MSHKLHHIVILKPGIFACSSCDKWIYRYGRIHQQCIDFKIKKYLRENPHNGYDDLHNFAEKNNNIYKIMFGTVIKDFEHI